MRARRRRLSRIRESEAVKTIARRISKLEERFAPRVDERSRRIIEAVRRRLFERRHPRIDVFQFDSFDRQVSHQFQDGYACGAVACRIRPTA